VVSAADKDKHTSAVPSALRQRCPQGFYPVQRYGAPRLTDELCALVTTLT
ncbi:transposase, partial [Shigella flexneri]